MRREHPFPIPNVPPGMTATLCSRIRRSVRVRAFIEVRTFASHPGRSSFLTHVEMRLVGDERIHAEGAAKVVWMDTRTGKSVPLPDHVRAEVEEE